MQNNGFETTAQTTEADERLAATPTHRRFRRSTVTAFFGGAVVTQPTDGPIECPGTPAPGVPLPATAPR